MASIWDRMRAAVGLVQRDPVCGMYVRPAAAAGSATHAGQTYYFCSEHCQTQFEADPARYT